MSESNDNIQTAPEESTEYTSEEVVAQYWQAGCAAYRQAIERAESAEQTDDIKPIATSAPYRSFASTRIGGRKENQDTAAFRETPDGLLLIVCDGMGGGPAGKRASLLAAHVISEYVARNAGSTDDRNMLT
ncbi:MAG: protein phosphatase 2C domain-containing protein, partial [Muribaculaceae bacterium]|nr:protein phosphatase 2C domain-containing protein [Muribaculaceae bacterium]